MTQSHVEIEPDSGFYDLEIDGQWFRFGRIEEIRDISNRLVAQVSYWERVERGMAEPPKSEDLSG